METMRSRRNLLAAPVVIIVGLLRVFTPVGAGSTSSTVATTTTTPATDNNVRQPPSITLGPVPSIYFVSGSLVKLTCGATGSPAPTYSWKKDDKALDMNQENIERESGGTININPATQTDAATYQCFAKNQYGTSLSNTSVVAMTSIGSFPSGETTATYSPEQGEALQMPCHDKPASEPTAVYSWITTRPDNQSPEVVSTSSRIQIDQTTGTLHFANVIPEDDRRSVNRTYKCEVSNPNLLTKVVGSPAIISVMASSEKHRPAIIYTSDNRMTGLIGESISMMCFFSGNPTPTTWWNSSTGASIGSGRFVLSNYNTTLTINDIEPTDAGKYKCFAENDATKRIVTKNSIAEVDIDLAVEQVPTFVMSNDSVPSSPRDVNATDGDTVEFLCDAEGSSVSTVWYQNGQALVSSALPPKFSLSSDMTVLTIAGVCRECPDGSSDLTVIQCKVENSHGSSYAQGYLNVLLPTKVGSVSLASGTIEAGQDLAITCSATADPSTSVNITWTFGSDEYVFPDTLEATLRKSNVQTSDGGVYTCTVWNGYSNSSQDVTVTVSPQVTQSAADYWWVFLIIGLLFLLLLLLLLLIFCRRHNVGESYPVDEEEKKNGNDPVSDLKQSEFQDFQRIDGTQQQQLAAAAAVPPFLTFRDAVDGPAKGGDLSSNSLLGGGAADDAYRRDLAGGGRGGGDTASFGGDDPYQPGQQQQQQQQQRQRPTQIVLVGAAGQQQRQFHHHQQQQPLPRGDLDAAFSDRSSSPSTVVDRRGDDRFRVNYPGSQMGVADQQRSLQNGYNAARLGDDRFNASHQHQQYADYNDDDDRDVVVRAAGYTNNPGGLLLNPAALQQTAGHHRDDWMMRDQSPPERDHVSPSSVGRGSAGHGVVLSPPAAGYGIGGGEGGGGTQGGHAATAQFFPPPPRQSMLLRGYSDDDDDYGRYSAGYDGGGGDAWRHLANENEPPRGGGGGYSYDSSPGMPHYAIPVSRQSMRNADESSV